MMVQMLYSKIRFATVTKSSFKYKGSIGIDEDIMDELGILENQVVNVNGMGGEIRTETYVIPEERGSRAVVVRGALANYLYKGDICHINVYVMMDYETAKTHKPIIIEKNK